MSGSDTAAPSDPQALAQASSAAMHARDRVAHDLAMEILEVGPGRAELAMTVTERMVNGHAICHGGYIFMLADTAFAHACNTHGEITVAAACDVQFLAPAKQGDRLLASARERQRGRRQGIYDVEVRNGETLIALFRGRSASSGKSIFEDEGTAP